MSEPSKEAMAAAEKLVRMEVAHETPDCTLVVTDVELYSVNASQGPMSEMYDTVCELQAGIATALDAHTADLQSEVEALRARVPVWKRFDIDGEPPEGKFIAVYKYGSKSVAGHAERRGNGYWAFIGGGYGHFLERHKMSHWQPFPEPPSE